MSMFRDYVALARPDHWVKNAFILPGVFLAWLLTRTLPTAFGARLFVGVMALNLVASANYVVNEWLDAAFDKHHPEKRNRPSARGAIRGRWVVVEYVVLAAAGLSLSALVSTSFAAAATALLVMGLMYNVPPIRTKEVPYLDVLSESVNNPLRLLMGWFIVTSAPLPPSSLVLGYWMGGAFLMAAKRFAEYRAIGDAEVAALYRHSFAHYSETSLLVSTFYYGSASAFFLGVFLVKYSVQVLLVVPFISLVFAWYLAIAFKEESAAQHPERLGKERPFLVFVVLVAVATAIALLVRVPTLEVLLENPFR